MCGAGPHQDSPPDVILEPPTIVKPRMLWSGKQVGQAFAWACAQKHIYALWYSFLL
jgi:hypothetical protein